MHGANISEAFRRVWARPWLLAALALANIGLSLLLSTPLSAMLSALLDLRPAALAMVNGDDGLLFELHGDHPELLAVAAVSAAAGMLLYGILCWVLDGGVLAALALDHDRRARDAAAVLAESARRAGRMVKLGLLGLLLRLIPLLLGAGAFAFARAVIKGRSYQPSLTASMLALVCAALAWSAVSVAIDYARGLSLENPRTRSWRLLARGVKLVFQRRSASLQLIAFSTAAWLAVAVLAWIIDGHLGALILLTIVRLLAVVARVAINMTTLTAAARVARA